MDYANEENGARTNADQSGLQPDFRVSFVSDDPRIRQVLAKLPPVRWPKPLPPLPIRKRSKQEFEAMRFDFREALLVAQDFWCANCGGRFSPSDPATLDHVQPLAKGGANWIGNLLLMHRTCNHTKGDASPSYELRRKLATINARLQANSTSARWFT